MGLFKRNDLDMPEKSTKIAEKSRLSKLSRSKRNTKLRKPFPNESLPQLNVIYKFQKK